MSKKPRVLKSVSALNSPVTTEDDASNPSFEDTALQSSAVMPRRYVITKDKVSSLSMEERKRKTDKDIAKLDLSKYKPEEIPLIHKFIAELSPDERTTMLIAMNHLESSFDIVRCNLYPR